MRVIGSHDISLTMTFWSPRGVSGRHLISSCRSKGWAVCQLRA